MANEISELVRAINAFSIPSEEDETDTECRLYALLDGADELPGFDAAAEPLYRLLERNAQCHLGSPGPVVHALEKIADSPALLRESLHRTPTYLTVWMVNRLLNSALSDVERTEWLRELDAARHHPSAAPDVIEDVNFFLEYQAGR